MADGIEALNLRHEYQKMFNWLNAASSSPNYSLGKPLRSQIFPLHSFLSITRHTPEV